MTNAMMNDMMMDEELDMVAGGTKVALVTGTYTNAKGKTVRDMYTLDYQGDLASLVSLLKGDIKGGLDKLNSSTKVSIKQGIREDKSSGLIASYAAKGYQIQYI